MSFRRAALALTVAAAFLAAACAAFATIVPQQSIAGAELGMTKAEVKGVLGEPSSVESGTNDFGPYKVFHYFRLTVTFQGNQQATAVSTRRFNEKTSKGIGRGSTEQELKDAHPGVKCKTEFGVRHCWLGRFRPGHRVTDFRIHDGKVSRVTVAFVID